MRMSAASGDGLVAPSPAAAVVYMSMGALWCRYCKGISYNHTIPVVHPPTHSPLPLAMVPPSPPRSSRPAKSITSYVGVANA